MKNLFILAAIIVIAGLSTTGGIFAYENKYLWIPISEEELRQKVSDFYYLEINHESCELNNYRDFNSKEDCQLGIRCISDKLSNTVPKEDLRKLANTMKEGERAESAVISYFERNSDVENSYKESIKDCSMWLIE